MSQNCVSVSVVISTYDAGRLDYVVDCIDSLKRQTILPDEIILALDPDKALVEFYCAQLSGTAKVVAAESCGLSNARNAGVRNAKGTIVAFIDDDAVADQKWLENLVSNYDDPSVVGVGGIAKPVWKHRRPVWLPEDLDWVIGCSYTGLPREKAAVRNPIGCNMSFRKSVFTSIGYFASTIGRYGKKPLAGEEAELSIKILRGIPGSRIVFDPTAIVHHKIADHRAKLSYVVRRSFYEGISKAMIRNYDHESSGILSTEETYLRHLIGSAIPSRLKRCYEYRNLQQLLTIFASIISVLLGYTVGRAGKLK